LCCSPPQTPASPIGSEAICVLGFGCVPSQCVCHLLWGRSLGANELSRHHAALRGWPHYHLQTGSWCLLLQAPLVRQWKKENAMPRYFLHREGYLFLVRGR